MKKKRTKILRMRCVSSLVSKRISNSWVGSELEEEDFVTFFSGYDRTPGRRQLRKKGFVFVHALKVGSIIAREAICSHVIAERTECKSVDGFLLFPVFTRSGPEPMGRCCMCSGWVFCSRQNTLESASQTHPTT